MKKNNKFLNITEKIFLFFILILSNFLFAETEYLSLENCIQKALNNNNIIKSTEFSTKKTEWLEYNSLTNFFPKIYLNESIIKIDDETYNKMNKNLSIGAITLPIKYGDLRGIKYKTTYTTELNLIQPIFNGGKLYFSYKINQLIHQQNILLLNNQKSEIIYKTVSLYFNLLKLQALEEIAEKNLKSTKEHLSIINEKYKQGLVQKSDVLQWKVKLENDKTNLEEIKNNKKIIHMFWLQCIWLDYPNKNIYPEKINIIDYKSKVLEYNNITDDDKEKKFEELYSTFLKNNYTIKSLHIMRKIAKNNYNLSYSNFLPSINLQYKKQFEKDNKFDFEGEKNWFIGVNINLPLFESGKNYTNFKKSYYEYQENKFKIKDIEENYQISFRNCFYNLISHSKKISNNELALENAKENNKIINNLYEQGMATNSELIDSEIMLFSSEINLLSSYYDFIINLYEYKKFMNNE